MHEEPDSLPQKQIQSALQEHGEELVDMYLDSMAEMLEELDKAVGSEKWQDVKNLSHGAIGSSAVLGFGEMADLFRRLENASGLDMPSARQTLQLLRTWIKGMSGTRLKSKGHTDSLPEGTNTHA